MQNTACSRCVQHRFSYVRGRQLDSLSSLLLAAAAMLTSSPSHTRLFAVDVLGTLNGGIALLIDLLVLSSAGPALGAARTRRLGALDTLAQDLFPPALSDGLFLLELLRGDVGRVRLLLFQFLELLGRVSLDQGLAAGHHRHLKRQVLAATFSLGFRHCGGWESFHSKRRFTGRRGLLSF